MIPLVFFYLGNLLFSGFFSNLRLFLYATKVTADNSTFTIMFTFTMPLVALALVILVDTSDTVD